MANFEPFKNCEGCKKRKEYLTQMLTDGRFWVGVAVGVVGVMVFKKVRG